VVGLLFSDTVEGDSATSTTAMVCINSLSSLGPPPIMEVVIEGAGNDERVHGRSPFWFRCDFLERLQVPVCVLSYTVPWRRDHYFWASYACMHMHV